MSRVHNTYFVGEQEPKYAIEGDNWRDEKDVLRRRVGDGWREYSLEELIADAPPKDPEIGQDYVHKVTGVRSTFIGGKWIPGYRDKEEDRIADIILKMVWDAEDQEYFKWEDDATDLVRWCNRMARRILLGGPRAHQIHQDEE